MHWLATLLLCCLLASGCYTAGKRGGDSALALYDLGPVTASPLLEPRRHPVALEVRAPLWFDSLGIDYRLAYVDAARLHEYARARWVGPPAQLIQQRLMRELDLAMAGQGQARCLMRVEISEFSQIFASQESSKGVLQGRAIFLDRSRRPLAELGLNIEKTAPSPDARGGVAALTSAVEQLTADLLAWEKKVIASGNAAGCSG